MLNHVPSVNIRYSRIFFIDFSLLIFILLFPFCFTKNIEHILSIFFFFVFWWCESWMCRYWHTFPLFWFAICKISFFAISPRSQSMAKYLNQKTKINEFFFLQNRRKYLILRKFWCSIFFFIENSIHSGDQRCVFVLLLGFESKEMKNLLNFTGLSFLQWKIAMLWWHSFAYHYNFFSVAIVSISFCMFG